ncbi:MAG TPA: HD domain-containing protein [Acidimicrobiales bacterium]|nr:HD domain-containing protein [Acidimicrobiales bacterium]
MQGFGSFGHLATRFFGALDPRGPSQAEEDWATGWLLPGEQRLWRRMSGPDRRHAAGVAREVGRRLGGAPREVMAAALLHDVGKVDSGLGTFARVWVTLAAMAVGRDRVPGRRAKRYLAHDRIGASLLRDAGSDPITVAWAGEHHRPEGCWTLDPTVAAALKAADGD